jgi:SAM-dependent methyltransferase
MRLSMQDLLTDTYRNVSLGELQKTHRLDPVSVPSSYAHYTPAQLLEHYRVEVELASRLRNSTKEERVRLYSSVYDELFRRLPFHPQLRKKQDPEVRRKSVESTLGMIRPWLRKNTVFLEIGPGDCALSFAVAKIAAKVYGVDVSGEITKHADIPANFQLVLSDGSSIEVEPGTVDLAYSTQLMEHLHPDDAFTQLTQIHKALAPGGKYLFLTPHRFSGPADVSAFFDEVATGLHLKEYTNGELARLLKDAGFSRVSSPKRVLGKYIRWPLGFAAALEKVIEPLPRSARRRAYRLARKVLAIRIMAEK